MFFSTGAYTAERAAALSGVPQSAVHAWARYKTLVPSVSTERTKLWSYWDLLALRVIYWLRQQKTDSLGADIPGTSMPAVRRALAQLRKFSIPVSSLVIDGSGHLHLKRPGGVYPAGGQLVRDDVINIVAPFRTREGGCGPDLVRPRRKLLIVPGKLGGSPHVEHTRLETRALAALRNDGMSFESIRELYPYLNDAQIRDALELEDQLVKNLSRRTAA
jgi:uncharacterized protein (DUF433 family)